MPWWEAPWAQWFGWTLLFAVIHWGVPEVLALLREKCVPGGRSDLIQIVGLLIPLLAAFLIGAHLHNWWWALGPPLAIVLLMAGYPLYSYLTMPVAKRQQSGQIILLAMAGILFSALVTFLAAAVGVWFGKIRLG